MASSTPSPSPMNDSNNNNNGSFSSTSSSTSPSVHDHGSSASSSSDLSIAPTKSTATGSATDSAAIKQEPSTLDADAAALASDEPSVWAHIFDENGILCLDVDDGDYPMDEADLVADPRRLMTMEATSASAANRGGGGGGGGLGGGALSGGGGGGVGGGTTAGAVYFPHQTNPFHEPTPSSALLDNWGYCDADVTSPSHHRHHQQYHHSHSHGHSHSRHHDDVSSQLKGMPGVDGNTPSMKTEPNTTGGVFGFSAATGDAAHHHDFRNHVHDPHLQRQLPYQVSTPSRTLVFDTHSSGQVFPLSKPILRDDGLLLVGTELPPESAAISSGRISNRIYMSDTRASDSSRPMQFVQTQAEVRDLQWLDKSTVLAAIGRDLQLVRVDGDASPSSPSRTCRVLPPLRRMHSDAIREVAVTTQSSSGSRSVMIASGGFDETVVLTTLGENGDPSVAKMTFKIDAFDVVSSVRWHPAEPARLSWTTDGGDFQVTDVRARAKPQLQVALNSLLEIEQMGGLFSHENISSAHVVLGFQMGQLLFLDLRMPRKEWCYGVMAAPFAPIGEIRRSANGTCALFGGGAFAVGRVSASGRELENITGMRPPNVQMGLHDYKTSGAFSAESGSLLGVSDSRGIVSIYTQDTKDTKLSAASLQAQRSATASPGGWQERAV